MDQLVFVFSGELVVRNGLGSFAVFHEHRFLRESLGLNIVQDFSGGQVKFRNRLVDERRGEADAAEQQKSDGEGFHLGCGTRSDVVVVCWIRPRREGRKGTALRSGVYGCLKERNEARVTSVSLWQAAD